MHHFLQDWSGYIQKLVGMQLPVILKYYPERKEGPVGKMEYHLVMLKDHLEMLDVVGLNEDSFIRWKRWQITEGNLSWIPLRQGDLCSIHAYLYSYTVWLICCQTLQPTLTNCNKLILLIRSPC